MPEDTWAADDSSICQFVGYMLDGFPVYGKECILVFEH